ncbi:MAG: hypothetical protein ACYDC2_00115 [Solirubrobacteraceae bacterium]
MRQVAVLVVSIVIALVALTAGSASAAPSATTATATVETPQGHLAVSVKVHRFYATAAGTRASGTATATLTPIGQHPQTISKTVTLAATRSGSCTILTLDLEELNLNLLGLNVHLEKVVLNVTGQPHGGVLGSLFCSLARAKVKAARVSALTHINSAIRRSGALQPLSFGVPVRASTSATGPTCSVLDLVLGPLNLNLLGLVVELNRVHLTVTAEPAGGVLGSLFCGLANTKIP